ncbi:MAG: hypothetical protein IJO93_06495 [Clostridia bacterium]|nr:hypothetical protein [Clostridia bacterium]
MKRITFIITVAVAIIMTCNSAMASSLSTLYRTDSSTGWTLRSDKYHMGSKSFDYQLSTGTENKGYGTYIDDAIGLWNSGATSGSSRIMKLTEVTSTDEGHFTTTVDLVCYKITRYNVSSSEVYEWSISIGATTEAALNGGVAATRNVSRIIANSLGYVYGLGYSSGTTVMRNPSTTSTWDVVQSMDKKALRVVTHAHMHTADFTLQGYETYNSTNHKLRCSYCKSYYLALHDFTGPHAGLYTCSDCGYVTNNITPVN